MRWYRWASVVFVISVVFTISAADWPRFRGPTGQGVSEEKGLPVEWSATSNIAWKSKLPGAGASSPVTQGKRIFVTCYSGYGMNMKVAGKQEDLKRHLLCLNRADGKVLWSKEFKPLLPEHNYNGEGAYHGYAASTPIIEGDRLYVFFGKSGVYCFDLDGSELWHSSVGDKTHHWGSGSSPIIYKNLLIVNASIESGALVALDKMNGKEKWRAKGINSAWNTPLIVTNPSGEQELVVSEEPRVKAFNPDTGKELWQSDGVHRYVIPSVVAQDGIVYAIGGGSTSLAVKTGGSGDVTKTNVVWRNTKGSNASSPILHNGHLYWVSESGGVLHCQDVKTGNVVFSERLAAGIDRIWASPVHADGKMYFVSQFKGIFVVAAKPKFELVAHHILDKDSRSNASLAVTDGQLLFRNDQDLYCIGKK